MLPERPGRYNTLIREAYTPVRQDLTKRLRSHFEGSED